MAAEFVSLADLLRPPAPPVAVPAAAPGDGAIGAPIAVPRDDGAFPATDAVDVLAAVREARLFRARLADAFDAAAHRMLRDLATDVLARELRLAPCDITALLRRIVAAAPAVRVRVAACDLASVHGVPAVADPALAAGDVVVEVAGGVVDARLGVRLATVLEAFA